MIDVCANAAVSTAATSGAELASGVGIAGSTVTPGSGFGVAGEGYFRISAFNSRANAEDVAQRLQELQW